MQKYYIIKNITAWMLDELLVFADNSKFSILFLREQKIFFKDKINLLEKKGVQIVYLDNYEVSLNKIYFTIFFIFRHFTCFCNKHSFIYGIKSIKYFLKTNCEIINEHSIKLHCQFATQASILGLIIKEYRGSNFTSLSITYHAYDIYINNLWINKLATKADCLLSISNYNINYLQENYKIKDPSKIKYSPLGVFIPKNIIQKQNPNILKIGFMAYFVEMKGIDYLLQAIKELKKQHIQFLVHIAGDGPLKNEMSSFIRKNNIEDRILFYGLIKDEQKETFFKNIDVFILPCTSNGIDTDGLPVVLMEAVSYGIPIISTKVTGIPEICINDYNGYLIDQRNVDLIVSSVVKLSSNPGLFPKFSKNSLEISQNYDIIKNSIKKLKILGWD